MKLAESSQNIDKHDPSKPGCPEPLNIRCTECIGMLNPVSMKIRDKQGEKNIVVHHCNNHWCKNHVASIENLKEMSISPVDDQTREIVSNPIIVRRQTAGNTGQSKKQSK